MTQADVDAGSVTNTATASGTARFLGAVTSNSSSVTVDTAGTSPASSLSQSAKSTYTDTATAGRRHHLLQLRGHQHGDDHHLEHRCERQPDRQRQLPGPVAGSRGLGDLHRPYTVTQADVDAGSVTNTATASGTNPQSVAVHSSPSSVTVDASDATSSLSLVKSAHHLHRHGYGKAGDVISYSYVVTNTGTTTISGIGVSDNMIASVNCPDSVAGPGDLETCTGSYAVTQADVDAGSVTNTATANGTNPQSVAVASNSSIGHGAGLGRHLQPEPGQVVDDDLLRPGYGTAGDVITYSYLVTNTGTTTVTGIGVSDNLVASVNCPDPSLAPGASETCTGTYTVTQADVDTGSVTNTATATGDHRPGRRSASNSSSVTVHASDATSGLSLVKSDAHSTGLQRRRQQHRLQLPGHQHRDDHGLGHRRDATTWSRVNCPDPSLAPGASETCTGTYTVTQADVDAGSVTNTATASGTTRTAAPVTSQPSRSPWSHQCHLERSAWSSRPPRPATAPPGDDHHLQLPGHQHRHHHAHRDRASPTTWSPRSPARTPPSPPGPRRPAPAATR